jgi:thiamine-phosphate pyrophosphorylase
MNRGTPPRVILVTDPTFADDVIVRCVRMAAGAMPEGWLSVQLRDKRRPFVSLRVFASRLRLVTAAVGASLVINRHSALARDVGADGVHLGRDATTVSEARAICGAGVWISVAAHSDDDVSAAVEAGADAVLVSPVFSTRVPSLAADPGDGSKLGRGVGALGSACAIAGGRLAVYALGGVTAGNARACMGAGANGIAVIRALLNSAEPARAARALHDAVALHC